MIRRHPHEGGLHAVVSVHLEEAGAGAVAHVPRPEDEARAPGGTRRHGHLGALLEEGGALRGAVDALGLRGEPACAGALERDGEREAARWRRRWRRWRRRRWGRRWRRWRRRRRWWRWRRGRRDRLERSDRRRVGLQAQITRRGARAGAA